MPSVFLDARLNNDSFYMLPGPPARSGPPCRAALWEVRLTYPGGPRRRPPPSLSLRSAVLWRKEGRRNGEPSPDWRLAATSSLGGTGGNMTKVHRMKCDYYAFHCFVKIVPLNLLKIPNDFHCTDSMGIRRYWTIIAGKRYHHLDFFFS